MSGLAFIGFGEAASAFATGISASNRAPGSSATVPDRLAAMARCGVAPADSNAAAIVDAEAILSLVTASQALVAAREMSVVIAPGTLHLDMNSVAPQTKQRAAQAIEAAGGRYVDVAVMAPVLPARRAVPLLVSGPHAEAGAEALGRAGFSAARVLQGGVGAASAIKIIRSVLIRGLEALTAECFLAADAAGVTAEVAASLDASSPAADWVACADYNLERIAVHGLRRADEMAVAA